MEKSATSGRHRQPRQSRASSRIKAARLSTAAGDEGPLQLLGDCSSAPDFRSPDEAIQSSINGTTIMCFCCCCCYCSSNCLDCLNSVPVDPPLLLDTDKDEDDDEPSDGQAVFSKPFKSSSLVRHLSAHRFCTLAISTLLSLLIFSVCGGSGNHHQPSPSCPGTAASNSVQIWRNLIPNESLSSMNDKDLKTAAWLLLDNCPNHHHHHHHPTPGPGSRSIQPYNLDRGNFLIKFLDNKKLPPLGDPSIRIPFCQTEQTKLQSKDNPSDIYYCPQSNEKDINPEISSNFVEEREEDDTFQKHQVYSGGNWNFLRKLQYIEEEENEDVDDVEDIDYLEDPYEEITRSKRSLEVINEDLPKVPDEPVLNRNFRKNAIEPELDSSRKSLANFFAETLKKSKAIKGNSTIISKGQSTSKCKLIIDGNKQSLRAKIARIKALSRRLRKFRHSVGGSGGRRGKMQDGPPPTQLNKNFLTDEERQRLIVENFCGKSYLQGRLPGIIEGLERRLMTNEHNHINQKNYASSDRMTLLDKEMQLKSQLEKERANNWQHKDNEGSTNRWTENDNRFSRVVDPNFSSKNDLLRLEVIKEQILKKLGLKEKPNVTSFWNPKQQKEKEAKDSNKIVAKKTPFPGNYLDGSGNNKTQFYIHDSTRPVDREFHLSKELILATLYRAQLDANDQGKDGSSENGVPKNRLFDDLHLDSSSRQHRKKKKKVRKKKKKFRTKEELLTHHHVHFASHGQQQLPDEVEGDGNGETPIQLQQQRYSHHPEAEQGPASGGESEELDDDVDLDEEEQEEQEENSYDNDYEDVEEGLDEDYYGQTREIIAFADRGKLLNGRQHLLEFSPVGDHQSIGEEFRIRVAVLWLKVENTESHRTNVGKNVTIWLFNVKQPEWDEAEFVECSSSFPFHRNREGSDITTPNCNSTVRYNSDRKYWIDDSPDLNLDEKEFDQVSDLVTSQVIQLRGTPSDPLNSAKYYHHSTRKRKKKRWSSPEAEEIYFMRASEERLDENQSQAFSNHGWQKFDITTVVKRWYNVNKTVAGKKLNLHLLVDCTGCRGKGVKVHLFNEELSDENRPFLVVHTEPNAMKRVRRRALDCSGAQNGQCCKQRFYVSFKALGWDDWIIAPHGYFANYCRGSCGGLYRTPDTFLTYYTHILDEFRKKDKLSGMQPCCAPLKFSSMSLIYFGPGRKIIKRDLPKMVVDECGCP